ncbi:MAG: substrate-binding domain-containing protein [Pseudolabrys sp.]
MRKTLLEAKSIAYSDSGSGTYLSTVGFKKLGIAEQVAGKSHKVRGPPSGESVAAFVAKGGAEIGFQQVAELINVPGADFVGTVPPEFQPPAFFVGLLTANTKTAGSGRCAFEVPVIGAGGRGHYQGRAEAAGALVKPPQIEAHGAGSGDIPQEAFIAARTVGV